MLSRGAKEKRLAIRISSCFFTVDVIEEYVRPARYVQNKSLIIKEALSETELVEFDEIGTLKAGI